MNRFHKIFLSLLVTAVLFGCSGGSSSESSSGLKLTILQTTDMHHHMKGVGHYSGSSAAAQGGLSRVADVVEDIRNDVNNPVVVVDSGDFLMGSVYDMSNGDSPAIMATMQSIGYDAITLGNHEFDYGPAMLAGMIMNARNNTSLPFNIPIIASNMDSSASTEIQALVAGGIIAPYTIKTLPNGLKVAFIGLMGTQAYLYAPMAGSVTFDTYFNADGSPNSTNIAELQALIDDLRNNQGVNIVIALSHSGNSTSAGTAGEDSGIAQLTTGIDVICSGHAHAELDPDDLTGDMDGKALIVTSAVDSNWKTNIICAGEYSKNIARIDLSYSSANNNTSVVSGELVALDGSGFSAILDAVIAQITSAIDTVLNTAGAFAALGLTDNDSIFDTVSKNDTAINKTSITGTPVGESVLGNLCADSYRNAINANRGTAGAIEAMTGDANPVQIAFVPGGVIRDPLASGNISFADLYNVLPLGADPLDSSALGYPLVTAYVKAADIYTIVGISLMMGMDAGNSFASPNDEFFINFAGIGVRMGGNVNGLGIGFDVYLCGTDTNSQSPNYGINSNFAPADITTATFINPTDTTTLYKVVVDLYTLMMMYQVSAIDPTKSVKIYDQSGVELTQVQASARRVVLGSTNMRAWQAIMGWSAGATSMGAANLSAAGYVYPGVNKRYQ